MKIKFLTICLDAMRFLPTQLITFNRLHLDWEWLIVEGVAAPVKDTAWCKSIPPRLSKDGTTEFLDVLKRNHPRVKVFWRDLWHGKTEMCNFAIDAIKEPCLLLQVDADEFWTSEQIQDMVAACKANPDFNSGRFFCRYFLGPNIVAVGENCYGNNPGEWLRLFAFEPGMRFKTHEPPFLEGVSGKDEAAFSREQTRAWGLVFDHQAYCWQEQLEFKQEYYGYENAVRHWQRLQANTVWPVKLKDYLPWTDDRAQADLLYHP